MSRTVTFKAPEDLVSELNRLAALWGVSRSAVIKSALAEFIRKYRDAIPKRDNSIKVRVVWVG